MDPNLLPKNSRAMETSEQAKLKRIRASLDVALNSPQPEVKTKTVKKKSGGFWKNLFGAPVSPIKDSALTNPDISKNASKSLDLLSSGKSIKDIVNRQPIKPEVKPYIGKPMPKIAKESFWKRLTQKKPPRQVEIKPILKQSEVKQPAYQPVYKHAPAATASYQKPEPKKHEKPHRDSKATTPFHLVPKHEKSAEVNVNLMPQDLTARRATPDTSHIKATIIAVLAPLVVLTMGFGIISLMQNDLKARMTAKQSEFNGLEKQIGDFLSREKQNNIIADRVAIISKLTAEKIIWNNFFEKLEKYTLDGVYYNNLTADTSGVLTLPGIADDYETLAKQLAVFKSADDFIKDANLTSAQLVSEGKAGVIGVGFQLRLKLAEGLFKKTAVAQ